jgi:farnesyl-diphosphate farnesyltransferase
MRLLPPALREPVGVGYLLARATDTIADTATLPAAERETMLAMLASAIDGSVSGRAAIGQLVSAFAPRQADGHEQWLILALPQCLEWLDAQTPEDREDIRTVLRHITRGQALDVERFGAGGPPRALANAAELNEYTYLVAGCVGEFWTALCFRHLPGFATLPREQMLALGRDYGMGLQLVNVLRDMGEDLASGRCYLPADELLAAGVQPQDILSRPADAGAVRGKWLATAEQRLAQGMRYADAVNGRRVRAASALPALIGIRTLALLREAGPAALQGKIKVPRAEVRGMLWRLAATLAARGPLEAQFARLGSAGGAPRMGQ